VFVLSKTDCRKRQDAEAFAKRFETVMSSWKTWMLRMVIDPSTIRLSIDWYYSQDALCRTWRGSALH